MAIDWNILRPQRGPGPEIASISAMLDSFAENRMRQQQAAQEQAFRERQFQAQQANIAADNARADAQMRQQAEQHAAAAAAAKAKEEQARAQTFAEKALPGAQSALRNNDIQGARMAVQPYDGDIAQDTSGADAANAAMAQRREGAAGMWSPLEPVGGLLGGLPQIAQAAAAQPTADETRQMAPRYKISGPAGKTLDYSPLEAEEGERAGYERTAKTATTAAASVRSPYSARILQTAMANARAGATPEEAVTRALAAGSHAEDEAASTKRAAMSAGLRKGAGDDAATARATALVERAVTDADKMVDWKGLVQMDNSLRSAIANATAPGSLPHKDAQIQLARVFRGTTPTEGEMHLLYNNLGGTMDKWNQFIAKMEDGDLSDKQLAELRNASELAYQEVNHRKERALKALRTKFNSPTYQMMAPQINAEISARAATVGVDIPSDALLPETEGEAPTLLGSRKGKGAKKPAAPKARKSPEDWVKEFQ